MKFFSSLNEIQPDSGTYLTFGKFDSLHLGHYHLLQNLVAWANETDTPTLILSFRNNPQAFLQKKEEPKPLLPLAIRKQFLENIGITTYLYLPFDEQFSQLNATQFVQQILLDRLKMSGILFGYNSRFGYQGKGNFQLLNSWGQQAGFIAREFPEYTVGGEAVSSFRIRNCLANGEIELANRLLGRSYTIYGTVISGDRLGRTLHFPTANLQTNQFLPKNGVYGVHVVLPNHQCFQGVLNIGTRPTVSVAPELRVEVHLLGFQGDLYGQSLEVQIRHHLRSEKKFSSTEELTQQIQRDIHQFQSLRDHFPKI
ncbi:MAG: riboflavin biosynthesis protein RibF [Planctomycetota bacterium]